MTLKTFITNTLLEIGKDLELAKSIEKKITDYARTLSGESRSVAISDDDVKELIIKYANDPDTKVETKKAVEKPKTAKLEKVEQVGLW